MSYAEVGRVSPVTVVKEYSNLTNICQDVTSVGQSTTDAWNTCKTNIKYILFLM